MSLAITTAPTTEPVSLEEFRAWLGWTSNDDAVVMRELVFAARQYVEAILWRQLLTATITWKLDYFPHTLYPPRPPLIGVTAISYIDMNGATQVLASNRYQVITGDDGQIVEAYGTTWPAIRCQPEAVTVVYTAGYGANPHSVPEPIRHAILMTAGHWWKHRECADATMPMAATRMIDAYRSLDYRRLLGV